MATPCCLSSRRSPNSTRTSWPVSDEVGSSRISTFGLRHIALAISTSCRRPSGSASTGRSSGTSRPSCLLRAAAFPARVAKSMKPPRAGMAPSAMFSATERCGARLSSCWTTAMPSARACAGLSAPGLRPATVIAPSIRLQHAREQVDQRALAGAVLAEQRMHAARPDLDRHALEHGIVEEGLPQIPCFEERRRLRHAVALSIRSDDARLLLEEQLVEHLQAILGIDVAVGRELVGAGEVFVEVVIRDDRQAAPRRTPARPFPRAPSPRRRRRARPASWAASWPSP